MEPRKATDILLDIELKLDQILAIVRAQDLNTKVLSNKLNGVIAQLSNVGQATVANSTPTIEAAEPVIQETLNIKVEADPLGFRRTSRPETYATPTQLAQTSKPEPAMPTVAEVSVPPINQLGRSATPQPTEEWQTISMPSLPRMQSEEPSANIGKISVEQRIVDKNGKAVFLANIEITNKQTNKLETKTRTTSAGKWQAVLPPGVYDVKISKSESLTKERIEMHQEVKVEGRSPTQTLPMIIAK